MTEQRKIFVKEAVEDAEFARVIVSQLEECDREYR